MYKHKDWMRNVWKMEKAYWHNNGVFQKELEELQKLVPFSGTCKNKALETIRCLNSFYYDRYNNGHCNNRAKEAATVRRFMKRHGAPSHLKFIIAQRDSELEDACDWVIKKCHDIYMNVEKKSLVVEEVA